MTSFRCSLTRFFNLKGMERYLYTEISARLNRDKIRTLIIDDEMEAELEENLGGEIDLPVLRLHEAGIISRTIVDGEYVITPLVEPELQEVVQKNPVVSKELEDSSFVNHPLVWQCVRQFQLEFLQHFYVFLMEFLSQFHH